MAQAPKPPTPTSSVPTSRPNPLHGTSEQVTVPGMPPAPDVAPASGGDPPHVSDVTKAEMAAGREAIATHESRAKVEHDTGKKAIGRHEKDE
jgi:hypothetical protein